MKHISGKVNPANIFTKEMKDGSHFWCLQVFYMSCLSNFKTSALLAAHRAQQLSPTNVLPAAAAHLLTFWLWPLLLFVVPTPPCPICLVPVDSFFKTFMVSFLQFFHGLLFFVSSATFCFLASSQVQLGNQPGCFVSWFHSGARMGGVGLSVILASVDRISKLTSDQYDPQTDPFLSLGS